MTDVCDVLVIGAGPAGGAAAIVAGRAGVRTLLVDRAAFPRPKVCGGCVSPAGLSALREMGMRVEMARVDSIAIWSRGRVGTVRTRAGGVVERGALDAAMAEHAQRCGATLAMECSARVVACDGRGVRVRVTERGVHRTTMSRAVVCADGLGGRSLEGAAAMPSAVPECAPAFEVDVWPESRMGLGAIVDAHVLSGPALRDRAITMMVGEGGYVGFARLADGRVDVAAAVVPALIESQRSAAGAIASLVEEASGDASLARQVRSIDAWKGTPLLTRRRRSVEAMGVLVAGDAAGYAEPFTGEGMTWAIASGVRAGECAAAMVRGAHASGAYQAWWNQRIAGQHRRAMRLARVLRVPGLVSLGVGVASASEGVSGLLSRVAGSWGGRGARGRVA